MVKSLRFTIFILAVIILAFLSLWRGLNFHFWRDDWGNLWELTYHPEVSVYFDNGVSLRRHPGLAVEKVIGNKFFGQNIFAWQLFGIFLRVLDSLVVALMLFGLTRSRKAAILAGLFMASAIGGLEAVTWLSAHTAGIFIVFLCTGVFFWAKSLEDSDKRYMNFGLALALLSVAVSITPAAGLLVIPTLALWDLLNWLRIRNRQFFFRFLLRNVLSGLTLFTVVGWLNSKLTIFGRGDILNTAKSAFLNPILFKNYLSSLGNLLTSWFLQTNEPISLSTPTVINLWSGGFFVLVSFLIIIMYLVKKSRNLQVAAFFSIWMFLFYLPNWLYEKTLTVGGSHRYLAVSTVAFIGLVALLLSKFKLRFLILFSLLFIIFNVIAANKLLEDISQYRSYKTVESIWSQIDREVPPEQKNLIFMYFGSDLVWGTSMNWSGSVPFAIKRGIEDSYDFPIVTGDRQLVASLLCEPRVYRPTLGGWVTQKNRIPISHLYAWEWDGRVLTNISDKERDSFRKVVPCKVLP